VSEKPTFHFHLKLLKITKFIALAQINTRYEMGCDESEVCKRVYLWLGGENEWKGKSGVVKTVLQLKKFSMLMP